MGWGQDTNLLGPYVPYFVHLFVGVDVRAKQFVDPAMWLIR